jgi:hypothetical protein
LNTFIFRLSSENAFFIQADFTSKIGEFDIRKKTKTFSAEGAPQSSMNRKMGAPSDMNSASLAAQRRIPKTAW